MKEPFDFSDLAYLSIPLPDDIAALHYMGRYAEELTRIDEILAITPDAAMRKRLTLAKFIARGLTEDYNTDEPTLISKIQEKFPAFTSAHLREIMDIGHADYIRRPDGFYFESAARSNILNCCDTYLRRITEPDYIPGVEDEFLHANIRCMQEHGGRAYRYTVREKVWVDDSAVREGAIFRAWLPYPAVTPEITDRKLLSASHETKITDGPIATAYAEFPYHAGEKYEIELAFTNAVKYIEITDEGVAPDQPIMPEYLSEKLPHIQFTPYLRLLEREITGGHPNPLVRARRIYEYITHTVRYSYMREYRYIENIPMFAAINHRGDCGVQALLFITLARISGIPAKWQSGNYITPGHIGSHDWALFYVAPYGWMQCDPSFGGGAYRRGDMVVHDFYFCHADAYRYIACTDFQCQLSPAKTYMRLDPYDNQSGEAEYADAVLRGDDLWLRKEVVSAEDLTEV